MAVDPFEQSQVFQLQLHDDPDTVATNFDDLLNAITEHISTHIWRGQGFVEGVLITPKVAGHFIIEILPPTTWTHNNTGPLRLLFAFENLYCVGFHRRVNWYLFSDNYETMKKKGLTQGTNIRSLNIDGNYNRLGPSFRNVNLGQFALFEIYKGVQRFPGSHIEGPLRMSAVSFSESLRFPRFRQHILVRMRTADCQTEDITKFSEHFRSWSVYSEMVRSGINAFVPIPEIDVHSFNDLRNFISMVL